LQYQLANKDVPMDRTLSVLAYLGWNFDTRIPSLSWAMFALQPFGLFAVLRRGGPVAGVAAGWAVAATLFPWWMSQSLPAQNPRNQVDFLPAGALLAAWGAMTVAAPIATRLRVAAVSTSWAVVAAFLVLSAEPLADLLCRPVSPQETGAGFDYQVEANVFDTSIPKNAGFHFRPAYMRTQYGRYADGVFARGEIRLDERSAIATARAEWLDPRVSSRFTEECVFTRAFRVLLYLPSGPGCTAAKAWVGALADAGYAPALLEEGGRAKDRGDLAEAEAMLLRAAGTVRAHPVAWLALGNVREQRMDAAGMLVAADRAVAVAKEWHFPGPTIAEALRLRARALAMLGHKEEGEATLATATCAKGARFPTFCGTPLQRLAGTLGPASGSPLPPLPALAESQQPAPPEAPPAWTTRLALWTLDGEVLPADWFHGSTPGGTPRAWLDPTPGGAVLVLAADPGEPVALACAPLLPASARMALRMRWKLDAEDPTQRGRFTVEARMADAGGKVRTVLGTPVAERVVQAGTTTPWRVDRFDFRAPNAAQVRLCLKAEAPGRIRATVDWVEALRVTEGGGP
jgi:hypothetical protein